MTPRRLFASRSAADWQAETLPVARNGAVSAHRVRARLYTEVQS